MAGPENLNTLGAPAEGFGQNVTFAFAPDPRGMSQSQAAGVELVRSGIQGQPVAGAGYTAANLAAVPEARPDPALSALFKLATKKLDGSIQQARQENYVRGMQMAQQGAAVADIVAEQPWWSRIMGDSDVAEGARAWTQNAKVAETVTGWETSMPTLRTKSAPEIQDWLSKSIRGAMTGDAATDSAIMQGFARHAPSFLKSQAKEHYAWQQESAYTALNDSTYKTGLLLQATLNNRTMSGADREGLKAKFATFLVPADRVNTDSWRKSNLTAAARWAEEGNLIPLQAMIEGFNETGGSAVFGQENMVKLENLLQAGAKQQVQKVREGPEFLQFMQTLAADEATGKMTVEDAANRMEMFDFQVRDRLGLPDDTKVIGNMEVLRMQDSVRSMIKAQENAQLRDQIALAKAAAKENQKAANEQATLAAWGQANVAVLDQLDGWTNGDRDGTISAAIQQSGLLAPMPVQPGTVGEKMARVWQFNAMSPGGHLPKMLKSNLQAQMTAGLTAQDPGPLASAYNTALNFVSGLNPRDRYTVWKETYGDDQAARLERMYQSANGGRIEATTASAGLFLVAREQPKPLREYPETKRKAIVGEIDNLDRTIWGAVSGANSTRPPVKIRPASRDLIGSMMAGRIDASTAPTLEQAASSARADVLRGDVELLGGYAVVTSSGQPRLMESIGKQLVDAGHVVVGDTLANDVDKAVQTLLGDTGEGDHLVQYMDGQLYFVDAKTSKLRQMTPGQIAEAVVAQKKKAAEGNGVGPKLTTLPDDDAPSIYAGPEKWAAYRERQKQKRN